MDFIQVDNPFDSLNDPPPAEIIEQQHLIAECAARPGGHAWTVEGDSGDSPWLSCADCPASGDDVYPDVIDMLGDEPYELGGRTIVFGQELPDDDTSVFTIPVHVRVKETRYTSMNCIGYEYDVEIHITDRETAA
jgi:hypothetical protein